MKITKVKDLKALLESCNPEADVFMDFCIGEITDIVSVDQPHADVVVIKCQEGLYLDQLTNRIDNLEERIKEWLKPPKRIFIPGL